MASSPLMTALEREHREIDEVVHRHVADGGSGADSRQQLRRATRLLRHHIHLEEELLFPALSEAGLAAPVFVMLREHGRMWAVLDSLDALLDAEAADGGTEVAACTRLFDLLRRHNPNEETILYPQVDDVLPTTLTAQVQHALDSGEMPAGWTCKQVPAQAGREG